MLLVFKAIQEKLSWKVEGSGWGTRAKGKGEGVRT